MRKILPLILALLLLAGCAGAPAAQSTPTTQTTVPTTQAIEAVVVPDKLIALTFDDGPNKRNSMQDVLAILEQYDAKATFFLIGRLIDVETKEVVLQAHKAGHELGNHSYSHIRMNTMNKDEVIQEYQQVQDLVRIITGSEPKFFRTPFLATSDTLLSTVPAPIIHGYAPGDSDEGIDPATIAARVLRNAKDGGIILMHVSKGYDWTEQALHTIIPELRKQGYEFVTVSELFARKGITPQNGIVYEFAE